MWVWMSLAAAADPWAAIAVGPPMQSGWAKDQPSKEAAFQGALASCAHPTCRVELQVVGGRCGSIAEGTGGLIAWAWGPEEEQTRAWALSRCGKKDHGCRTLETVCNSRKSDWGDKWRDRAAPTPVPVPTPPQTGGVIPPTPIDPAVIQACEVGFDGDANEDLCLAAIRGCRFDPVRTIQSCEQAFDGDANELQCVRVAARAHVPISSGLSTCEQAFDGDANELACLELIVQSSVDATPYIQQCEQSKDGDANELSCLRTVLGL